MRQDHWVIAVVTTHGKTQTILEVKTNAIEAEDDCQPICVVFILSRLAASSEEIISAGRFPFDRKATSDSQNDVIDEKSGLTQYSTASKCPAAAPFFKACSTNGLSVFPAFV